MEEYTHQNAKVIFSPQLSNYLLKQGYTIIKLKPKNNNPDEAVFVFKFEDGLLEAIEDWMKLDNCKNNKL